MAIVLSISITRLLAINLVPDELKTMSFFESILIECPHFFKHCPDFIRSSEESLAIAMEFWIQNAQQVLDEEPQNVFGPQNLSNTYRHSPLFHASEELRNDIRVCLRMSSSEENVQRIILADIPEAVSSHEAFILGAIRYNLQISKELMKEHHPELDFDFYVKAFLVYSENIEVIKEFPEIFLADDDFWIEVLNQNPRMLHSPSFPQDLKVDWYFLRDRVIPKVTSLIRHAFSPEMGTLARFFSHSLHYPKRMGSHIVLFHLFNKMLKENWL